MSVLPAYKDEQRGTWYASFYYTDWRGSRKLKKKRGFSRKKDAEEYEREFLRKEAGTCDMSFASMTELYLKDMGPRLRESTVVMKKSVIEKWVLPFFGEMKINEISPTAVRRWQSHLLGEKLAPSYVKTIHNQLSAIFNYAGRYYNLPSNPARLAGSVGKKEGSEIHFWTPEDFNAFIDHVPKYPGRVGLTVLFWTGLRIGELLALTPEDIDLEARTLTVSKTYQTIEGREVVTPPKTRKSRRVITLPPKIVDTIREYEGHLYDLQPGDRLFPFTKSYFHQQMAKGCDKAGMEKIRLHDLRHSHASMLIHMGEPILLVSERLGHEDIETTLRTYGHLYPSASSEAVRKMDALIPESAGLVKKPKLSPIDQNGPDSDL